MIPWELLEPQVMRGVTTSQFADQAQTCTPELCARSVSTEQPRSGDVLSAGLIQLTPKHKRTQGAGTAGDGAGDARLNVPAW